MAFQRPIVPSIALERICFTFALVALLLMAVYFLWQLSLGRLVVSQLPELVLVVAFAILPSVCLGLWLRYMRQRKILALREHEHILRQITGN